jgi:hypothetical protein
MKTATNDLSRTCEAFATERIKEALGISTSAAQYLEAFGFASPSRREVRACEKALQKKYGKPVKIDGVKHWLIDNSRLSPDSPLWAWLFESPADHLLLASTIQ